MIPTVAFLVLAGLNISASVATAQTYSQGGDLARLARRITALTHELQVERGLTSGYMTKGWSNLEQGQLNSLIQRANTADQLAKNYLDAAGDLYDDLDPTLQARFDLARTKLEQIASLREGARSGALTREAVFNEYSSLLSALLDINSTLAQRGGSEEFSQRARVFADMSQAKEVTAQVRGTLYAIAIRGSFAFGEFQDFADLLAREQAALDQFQTDANDRQRTLFGDIVEGQAVLAALRVQETAVNRQASQRLEIDPSQWLAASTTQIELLRTVEVELLDDVVEQAGELAGAAQRQAFVNAIVIAVILGVALITSLFIAGSMVRPLRRLRSAALNVAQSRLPDAVERMRTTNSGELDVDIEPVGVASRDEIGEVAGAFDTVHQVAVKVAAEQAALRRSINDMFVNLARRNQTLIDRQLNMIEDLERDTEDPNEMAELFRLDHLATRMRRNQENLLVLASAEPAKRWSDPIPLAHLLRAAAAEVEDFTRVELLTNDDAMVVGYTTSDIVHLLAELIENATMFSPPHTPVRIATQAAANGYLVEIEDQGTGMNDNDLLAANERLADPPQIDFALSRRLGFFVVGRLAKRHGIRVQLRHSWYGGVTALVLIPENLFMPGTIAPPVGQRRVNDHVPELHPPVNQAAPAFPPVNGTEHGNGRERAPAEFGRALEQPAGQPQPKAFDRPGTPRVPQEASGEAQPPVPAFTPRVTNNVRSRGAPPPPEQRPGGRERALEPPPAQDPLAEYHAGLVQGRLSSSFDAPPPLSPPISHFRRDDDNPS